MLLKEGCDKLVADLGSNLCVVDRTELMSAHYLPIGCKSCCNVLLLKSLFGFPAFSLCFLLPAILIQAISVEKYKSDHHPIKDIVGLTRHISQVETEDLICIQHYPPFLTHGSYLCTNLSKGPLTSSISRHRCIFRHRILSRCLFERVLQNQLIDWMSLCILFLFLITTLKIKIAVYSLEGLDWVIWASTSAL